MGPARAEGASVDDQLESEGVDKFEAAWVELLESVAMAMKEAGAAG